MIPRSKSLAVVPTIILLHKIAAFVVLGIGIVVTISNILSANQGVRLSIAGQETIVQSSASLITILSPVVVWGVAALLLYAVAVVINLLSEIEETTRATASYIYYQLNKQFKERPKL